MGRPQFAQPGTNGGGQTVAVQSRPEVTNVVQKKTSSLASGSSETIEFYAPTGSVYNVKAMKLKANQDNQWTAGSHLFKVSPVGAFDVLKGQSGYQNSLIFFRSHWASANEAKNPPDGAAQLLAVQGLQATENSPIRVQYKNDADLAQDNERVYKFVVTEESY